MNNLTNLMNNSSLSSWKLLNLNIHLNWLIFRAVAKIYHLFQHVRNHQTTTTIITTILVTAILINIRNNIRIWAIKSNSHYLPNLLHKLISIMNNTNNNQQEIIFPISKIILHHHHHYCRIIHHLWQCDSASEANV